MGLDMCLRRKKYVGANYDFRNVFGTIDIQIGNKKLPIDFNKVTYIEEEAGYWRKANAIHKWFVDNVQEGVDNCGTYYVSISELKSLLDICKEVVEKVKTENIKKTIKTYKDGELVDEEVDSFIITNVDEIESILPTMDGFFFGSTSYDEWYLDDVKITIEILEEVIQEEEKLNELGFYSDYYYHASW